MRKLWLVFVLLVLPSCAATMRSAADGLDDITDAYRDMAREAGHAVRTTAQVGREVGRITPDHFTVCVKHMAVGVDYLLVEEPGHDQQIGFHQVAAVDLGRGFFGSDRSEAIILVTGVRRYENLAMPVLDRDGKPLRITIRRDHDRRDAYEGCPLVDIIQRADRDGTVYLETRDKSLRF
jgi:hypothetical protein